MMDAREPLRFGRGVERLHNGVPSCRGDGEEPDWLARVRGNDILTIVPSPGLLCTLMPPCSAFTRLRTIDRPNPVPVAKLSSYSPLAMDYKTA